MKTISLFASLSLAALVAGSSLLPLPRLAAEPVTNAPTADPSTTTYHTVKVQGQDVFYREAGPKDAPVVLLLHGFPTSSHMFRALIPALADRYHVIAPDYPGFGQSSAPDHAAFAYTFAHYTDLVDDLLGQLGVDRYALYIMDYGAPVGLRLALKHPERVTALVTQNGNAYTEGLGEFWEPVKAYWQEPTAAHREALRWLVSLKATKFQYLDGVGDPTRVSPDNWVVDQVGLDRPGNAEAQLDLFYDYRTNVALYDEFHAFFRKFHPPTLVVWGKNDKIFVAPGAEAFRRDLPDAEVHLLETGHFALEDKGAEIAGLMRTFLARHLP